MKYVRIHAVKGLEGEMKMALQTNAGNFAGFHYSKKNCEEIIREFFKREGFEIDRYNMDFKTAKAWAVYIRQEPWYKEFFSKEVHIGKGEVKILVTAGLVTLKNPHLIEETNKSQR